jgi:tetratricopeptide (TPR) repeat protein
MHEMLGNQFFMARNYVRATDALERALQDNPKSKPIRRKLIICNTQVGHLDRAMNLFLSLVKEDADFIINTDPVDDDCPCPDLVYEFEIRLKENAGSLDDYLLLGILWLYCNVNKSIDYFNRALRIDPDNSRIRAVLALLTPHLH